MNCTRTGAEKRGNLLHNDVALEDGAMGLAGADAFVESKSSHFTSGQVSNRVGPGPVQRTETLANDFLHLIVKKDDNENQECWPRKEQARKKNKDNGNVAQINIHGLCCLQKENSISTQLNQQKVAS
jgi:hypothetical protein